MTSQLANPGARELAARLIAHASNEGEVGRDAAIPAAVALRRMAFELTTWVGAEGCHALLSRALSRAQPGHPSLGGVRIVREPRPSLEGLPDKVGATGSEPVAAGLEATVVALIDVMARLIGEDLTARLAEQSMTAARPAAPSRRKKRRDPHA